MKTLLEANAQIEARNKSKETALTCAARGGYIDNFWIAQLRSMRRINSGKLLWRWRLIGMGISRFQICSRTLGICDPTGLGILRRTGQLFALGSHAIQLSGGLAQASLKLTKRSVRAILTILTVLKIDFSQY